MRRVREIVALPSIHFDLKENFCVKDGAQSFQMGKIRGLTGGYSFFEDGQKLRSRFVIHIGGYLATVI